MPPFHSRSTGANRTARISSGGLSRVTSSSRPSAARISGPIGTDFAVRGHTPPPALIAVAVVVVPRRSRQREQPLPLGEPARGVRGRVDEHVPVVERRDQPDVRGQQHPVAEHVAGHVADPDDGDLLALGVDAQLAEVPLDALPGAAGGDAHGLVVVAHRPAGGERVAEPEPVGRGDLVGDVGELRRALVRGHHQVGVVAVVPHDVGRRTVALRPSGWTTRLSVTSSSPEMNVW